MVVWLGVCAAAAAAGVALGRAILPPGRPNAVQRGWQARLIEWRARRRGQDPFATLHIQTRLSELAAELESLHAGEGRFALAHHLRAAQSAYDDLLDEACELAGVGPIEGTGAVHRLLAESALRAAGWTW